MAAVYYSPTTAIRVCVDDIFGSRIIGRAYCTQLDDKVDFGDIGELVLSMEDMFDERGYPDAFQEKRLFTQKPKVITLSLAEKKQKQIKMREKRDISQDVGKCATFLVYVMSRRNSSWQGRIEWLDDGEAVSFNSALQFMRFVDAKIVHGKSPETENEAAVK